MVVVLNRRRSSGRCQGSCPSRPIVPGAERAELERRDFSLTVKFTTSYFGPFGTTYVYVCADPDGNVIVYKGSATIGKNGEAIKVKATIKEHGIRDGVCQTIIGRPKKI